MMLLTALSLSAALMASAAPAQTPIKPRAKVEALAAAIDAQFYDPGRAAKIAGELRAEAGKGTYDKLTDADRNALKGPITTLAEDLSLLRGVLGLD